MNNIPTHKVEVLDSPVAMHSESALVIFERMSFPFDEASLRHVVENMHLYENELVSFLDTLCSSYKETFIGIYDVFNDDRLFLALHTLVAAGSNRVFPYFLEVLSFPQEFLDETFGDQVTESFSGMLATVFDGNVDELCRVILDETIWEYCRWSAFDALKILAEKDEFLRLKIIDVMRELHGDRQTEIDVHLPFILLESVLNLRPVELRSEIPLWYARANLDYRDEGLMTCNEVITELDEQRYSNLNSYNYPYDLWSDFRNWQSIHATNEEYAWHQLNQIGHSNKEKQRRKNKAAKKARRKNRK